MPRIEPTEELLARLTKAQAKHTAAILVDPYNRMGDDWGDTTCSALDVMQALFNMQWDQCDLEALDAYLNTTYAEAAKSQYAMHNFAQSGGLTVALSHCAAEGICPEIHELNPPALAGEED